MQIYIFEFSKILTLLKLYLELLHAEVPTHFCYSITNKRLDWMLDLA